MGAALKNWKTSAAGVALGAAVLAAVAAYKPGMTLKEWAGAAVIAALAALPGILAHDGVAPAPKP
jgi:hypothetical protein